MIDALAGEVRERTLDGHLVVVGEPRTLHGTKLCVRCHFVARSPNGQVLLPKLGQKLAYQIVDYCIPPARIREAQASNSTEAILALQDEARRLFTTLETSGEAGELLLYLLLETVLQLPQLLCKMRLKTNARLHYNGADGIHGRILSNGNLALYWGESKLHASVNNAIDSCLSDLSPFLTDDGTGRSHRDLMLLREGVDLSDPRLVEALSHYFRDDTLESTKVEFRGAGLVGFDLTDYPDPHGAEGGTISELVADHLERWHQRIAGQVTKHSLERFTIEVFCVPVPSVDQLRDAVRDALRLDS